MATVITPQTLTATVSETINLNGQTINSENKILITSIAAIDKRIVNIPFSAPATVLIFGSAVAAGTVINANVRYIRITNKDASNFVRIRKTVASGQTYDEKLTAGNSMIFSTASLSANINGGAFSAFVTGDNITAQADTANVDLEIFVASI